MIFIGRGLRFTWVGTDQEDHLHGWEIWEQVQAIQLGIA